jgi:hypothetical protein
MLACYLIWHLRRAWAPLAYTDQILPVPDDPVAPARRSADARAKASGQHDEHVNRYYSSRGLLGHPHPRQHPLRHRHRHCPRARRAHPRPAAGLRADRLT